MFLKDKNNFTVTKADALTTARTIGKASFNGSANITLSQIMGHYTTTSSGNGTYNNKWTKFATIDLSSGAYKECAGQFIFTSKEADAFSGILQFYLRTGSAITSTSISLKWTELSNSSYATTVVAVKVSDGKHDLYFKPLANYTQMNITAFCQQVGYLTLYSNQSYVNSVTAAATSSLSGYVYNASTANTLATARTINGTSFNGSANITTANWGTARTLTIGSTGKSVNGSGNVSWTWNEMQVPRAHSASFGFGGNQNAITTAQFITLLTNAGAFSQPYWISRGSWSYAGNQIINDTGCGNIHLAGSVVEVIGSSSAYTIRVTTPTTGSGTNSAEFIYINNGADYSPGWRKQYNNKNKPTPAEIGAAAASHGKHVPDACTSITDWNNATTTGWYMASNATNAPTTAWYFGEVIAHNTNYLVQTVYQFTASADAKAIPKYIRAKMNGTWGAWTNVTVSIAVPSNAKFTDTNTWRGIQNVLTSTATDQSLSAAQGKILNDKITSLQNELGKSKSTLESNINSIKGVL